MNFNFFNHKRKRKRTMTVNGQTLTIEPLNIKEFFELFILVSPYLALFEDKWVEIKKIFRSRNRSNALSNFFMLFRRELTNFPDDVIKLFSILLKKDSNWIIENISPNDMIKILPVLDRVNNFRMLKNYIYVLDSIVQTKGK